MTNEFRRVVAGSLAAAVVIGAGAGAASAAVLEGGLEFSTPTWGAGDTPPNWDIDASLAFPGNGNLLDRPGYAPYDPDRFAPQEQEPLPGPPERLEEEAQLGQVADVAREAARAEVREQAAEPAPAAEAEARAEVAVPELAPAAEVAEPTNLGAAGAGIQTIAGPVVDASLLEITWEELIGPFPEGEQNTAALAAWDWFRLHGYRGIPGDGAEKLYAPSHPRYAETVLVGELPESVWCFPILPGSDVTDHAAEVLKAAGWFEADLWEPGGAPWLLPPEAAN